MDVRFEIRMRNVQVGDLKGLKDTVLFFKHSGNICYLLMSLYTNAFYYWSFFKKPQVLPRDRTQITKKKKKKNI